MLIISTILSLLFGGDLLGVMGFWNAHPIIAFLILLFELGGGGGSYSAYSSHERYDHYDYDDYAHGYDDIHDPHPAIPATTKPKPHIWEPTVEEKVKLYNLYLDMSSLEVRNAQNEEYGTTANQYSRALKIAVEKGTVSATSLQQELSIDHSKASSLIDEMGYNGIINRQAWLVDGYALKNPNKKSANHSHQHQNYSDTEQ
jgi:hypothetical protein